MLIEKEGKTYIMKRRDFLKKSSLFAFALTSMGCVVVKEQKFVGNCETTNDILGPFYRPNAPQRTNLDLYNEGGKKLKIVGKVFSNDCTTELENAIVEIWQANTKGGYDNDTSEYRYRSTAITPKKGDYTFDTIVPGRYLNGALLRPSHVHFRVRAAGHQELISQIYFKNDPYIEKDPWASDTKAQDRILEMIAEGDGSTVTFNIFLAKA